MSPLSPRHNGSVTTRWFQGSGPVSTSRGRHHRPRSVNARCNPAERAWPRKGRSHFVVRRHRNRPRPSQRTCWVRLSSSPSRASSDWISRSCSSWVRLAAAICRVHQCGCSTRLKKRPSNASNTVKTLLKSHQKPVRVVPATWNIVKPSKNPVKYSKIQ